MSRLGGEGARTVFILIIYPHFEFIMEGEKSNPGVKGRSRKFGGEKGGRRGVSTYGCFGNVCLRLGERRNGPVVSSDCKN